MWNSFSWTYTLHDANWLPSNTHNYPARKHARILTPAFLNKCNTQGPLPTQTMHFLRATASTKLPSALFDPRKTQMDILIICKYKMRKLEANINKTMSIYCMKNKNQICTPKKTHKKYSRRMDATQFEKQRHVFQIGHMNHETTLSKIGTLWQSATGHCCDHAHLGTCNSCQYCCVSFLNDGRNMRYQEHAESGEQLKLWRDNIPPFARFMALSYFDCKCRYRCSSFFVLCSSGLLAFPRFLIIEAILNSKKFKCKGFISF